MPCNRCTTCLLAEPVVLVGNLSRTKRTKLAVLRRELDVRGEWMRRKNLSAGSVVRRRRNYPIERLVRCLRHKHRRPPVNVSLRVNVLLLQDRSRRTAQRCVRALLMLSIDRGSPRGTTAARRRVLGVGMRWNRHKRRTTHGASTTAAHTAASSLIHRRRRR